jgi:hypothetical protein
MQLAFAFISALFAASTTFAAPAAQYRGAGQQTATISFSNDRSGRNAPILAPLDGTPIHIGQALANSAIAKGPNGVVEASSVQLVALPQRAHCTIYNYGAIIATLTPDKTYVDLDGYSSAVVPINLSYGTLMCGF